VRVSLPFLVDSIQFFKPFTIHYRLSTIHHSHFVDKDIQTKKAMKASPSGEKPSWLDLLLNFQELPEFRIQEARNITPQ